MNTTRTILKIIAAVAVMAVTMGSHGLALAQTKLKVTYLPTLDATPLFIGIEKGYFKEQGLEITPIPVAGGAAAIPGLMAGSYDILYGNIVSTLLARQQGLKVLVVGAGTKQFEDVGGTGLIARKADQFKSGKDLEGKTVAVNTRNGVIWLYARAWVAKTGGDPGKVTFREVPFPQMNDALRGKQVDAAFQIPPFFDMAVSTGEIDVIGEPYKDVQPGVEIGQYVATEDFYNKNRELIAKFRRGLSKGVAFFNANQKNPETIRVIAATTKLQPEMISKMDLGRLPDVIDPAMLARTAALMKENGLLSAEIDVKSLVVPEALQ